MKTKGAKTLIQNILSTLNQTRIQFENWLHLVFKFSFVPSWNEIFIALNWRTHNSKLNKEKKKKCNKLMALYLSWCFRDKKKWNLSGFSEGVRNILLALLWFDLLHCFEHLRLYCNDLRYIPLRFYYSRAVPGSTLRFCSYVLACNDNVRVYSYV